MNCVRCKAELPKGQTKCLKCGTKNYSTGFKVFTIILGIFTIFLLVISNNINSDQIKPTDSNKPEISEQSNKDEDTSHCQVEECISVELIGSDGKQLYIDKGLTKDKLAYDEEVYVSVNNSSEDCKFVGSIYMEGAGWAGQFGEMDIMPGGGKNLKYTLKDGNTKYRLNGEMIKVLDNDALSKYKILGSKSSDSLTSNNKFVRVGIEIPDGFTVESSSGICKDFITTYSKSISIEEITIYIYEQGYIMNDTSDMYKNALYAITAYMNEGGYAYDVEDLKNNDTLLSGELTN